ncbi:SoxR reducing system RseC family protein [Azospirillum oryzae]|uniref:SoxR reducing system RseC family protein n=1 Tax=Azospirillum oryzae TaxID=286727 RepID=UPI00117813A9|nr:SoxR reducing system RseC family protein [Azospirillum oryzae]
MIEEKNAIVSAYSLKYPEFTDINVDEFAQNSFGGTLAAVSYKINGQKNDGEICFVTEDGSVQIFGTTVELVRFLKYKATEHPLEKIFSRHILSGIIFFVLILAISIAGFFNFNDKAYTILGGVVGVAAGFFFGSKKEQK